MFKQTTIWSAVGIAMTLAACSSSGSDGPDLTAPAVTSATQNRTVDVTGSAVDVLFNERVEQVIAETITNYTVSGGLNVTAAVLQPDARTVRLSVDAPVIPGDFTVTILQAIEDLAGNPMAADAANTPVVSTDVLPPNASTIAGVTVEGNNNDTLSVIFNDNMVEAEVETVGNWTVESPVGSTFDITGATISYDDLTLTASITLDASVIDRNFFTGDSVAASFTTMRDIGGNTITATTIGVDAVNAMVMGDLASPQIVSISADGVASTINVRFSEHCRFLATADLLANTPVFGTRFVLNDADAVAGQASDGTVAFTGNPLDTDSLTISDGVTAVNFEFDAPATGTIAFTANPVDAQFVTISDGVTSVIFEFDTPDGITGDVAVTIGVDSDATMANLFTAINAHAFNVTASAGVAPSDIVVDNDALGVAGNVALLISGGAPIVVNGMAGGGIAGDIVVAIGTDSDATMANFFAAINAHAFNVTASAGGGASDIVLTNDNFSVAGNVALVEVDGGGNISFTGMANGIDSVGQIFNDPVSTTVDDDGLGVTVTYGMTPAPTTDTIELYGVTDLAGNPLFALPAEPVITADPAQPSLDTGNSVFSAISGEFNDTILVQFDRPMSPWGLSDVSNYTVDPGTAVDLSMADFAFDGNDQVTITFDNSMGHDIQPADNYDLSINDVETAQGVMRTVIDTEVGITPGGDNAIAPTIGATDARLDPQNADSLLIIFSEALDQTQAQTAASYVNAGNVATTAAQIGPRVVRATFGVNPSLADALDVAAAAATDLAGNQAAAVVNLTVAAADATAPTVTAVSGTAVFNDGFDFISVNFDEQVTLGSALAMANYSVTNNGTVALTGSSFSYDSTNARVTIMLPMGTHLDPASALSVTASNIMDVAGNTIVAAAVAGVVGGDVTAPDFDTAFVNLRQDPTGFMVDVRFDEDVDSAFATNAANWTVSGGQNVTAAQMISSDHYRLTLDAILGAGDTLSVTAIEDLAQNPSGLINVDPEE